MSIKTEIERITQAKTDLKTAIETKEVIIEENATIDTYAGKIDEVYSKGYEKGKAEGGGDNTILDSIVTKTITHLESQTVTKVGNTVFSDFTTLQSINLPSTTHIGDYSFRRCSSLSNVNLPMVTSLGMECFYGDTKLTYIDLPKVKSISRGVFSSSGIKTLIIRSEEIVSLANISAFGSSPIANGTGFIYVPDDLVESYKSATNWSTYANQIKGLSELEEVTE